MKKISYLSVFMLLFCSGFAQGQSNNSAGNPFEKFEYGETKIATLSQRKYAEFHDKKHIVKIGSFLYDTQSKKITGILEPDEIKYIAAMGKAEITSRFMSPDPLFREYAYNSPYTFAENKVIAFTELEGLEVALPRIGPVSIPRPVITIPRAPTIPIPQSPTIPLPPIGLEPVLNPIPAYPVSPSTSLNYESTIDWNNPPSSPQDLGEDWEETTHPDNKSGKRDFRHKDNGEKIRWDLGKKGKPGWEGKNHWHRYNPEGTGKRNLYLDRFGNAVQKGSNASHIGAGESLLQAIPGLVQDVQSQIINLQKQRDKLSVWDSNDWRAIKSIWNRIDVLEDYQESLQDYKKAWDDFQQEMNEYYENCNCKQMI